jgi:hypothetical protein
MTKVIDGKEIAKEDEDQRRIVDITPFRNLREKCSTMVQQLQGFKPGFAVV